MMDKQKAIAEVNQILMKFVEATSAIMELEDKVGELKKMQRMLYDQAKSLEEKVVADFSAGTPQEMAAKMAKETAQRLKMIREKDKMDIVNEL